VENRQSFSALASTNWEHELADLDVTSARITADGGTAVASYYQSSPVRVRFYHLDFQRQDLGQSRE
jgi:ribosomal protein L25 (general stress protein Ctc)